MASEVQVGNAVAFGIGAAGAVTISGYAAIIDSAKTSHKFKMEAVEDEVGFDTALIATNAHFEIDVQFTPKGTTAPAIITPLTTVALSGFNASGIDGNWLYIGDASIDLSKGPAKMQLKLRKYADDTQNTLLTT